MKTPLALAQSLNIYWLQRYGAASMSGNCGLLSYKLANKLVESGHSVSVVSGRFRGQRSNHAWVECDGQILDPTSSQYGDYPVLGDPANYLPRTKTPLKASR